MGEKMPFEIKRAQKGSLDSLAYKIVNTHPQEDFNQAYNSRLKGISKECNSRETRNFAAIDVIRGFVIDEVSEYLNNNHLTIHDVDTRGLIEKIKSHYSF